MLLRSSLLLSLTSISAHAASMHMETQSYPPQELRMLKDATILSAEANLVYYKLLHDGLTYVVTNSNTDATDRMLGKGKEVCLDPSWKPGFNLGVRAETSDDEYDFRLNWTYYRNGTSDSIGTNGSAFFIEPALTSPGLLQIPVLNNEIPAGGTISLIKEATARIDHTTNWADANVGRYFRPSGSIWLGARPHAGFRWLWMQDKLDYTLVREGLGGSFTIDPFTETGHLMNDYWGFGPRMGLDTEWGFKFAPEFQLYGNAAVTLLLGKYDVSSQTFIAEIDPILPTDVDVTLGKEYYNGRMMTDLELGVMWERIWDNWALALKLGFEHHYLRNGSHFGKDNDISSTGLIRNHGDIQFSGFVFGARIDY